MLDNAHELTGHPAARVPAGVVRHAAVRLVLAGHGAFPLSRQRLRERGGLREITADELAFTAAEAADLLGAHGLRLAPDDLALLLRRTSGQAARLRLAAMSLTRRGRPVAAAAVEVPWGHRLRAPCR
ncbi:hypothetical protein AB0I60_27395 [Actinosynnema sp. NPDC050436]|uniref:hypothetical protein n=1 Tax=Actinosynnema sp. NPDC050436 TaxID=3155659 RepID=UPI0033FE2E26